METWGRKRERNVVEVSQDGGRGKKVGEDEGEVLSGLNIYGSSIKAKAKKELWFALASISSRITSIHVFLGLPCAFLTCPKLIRSTRRTGASIGLRRT